MVNMLLSYEEYSNMCLVCGVCNSKATAAVEEYRERYPQQQTPNRCSLMFTNTCERKAPFQMKNAVLNIKYNNM
jgi:uncharacterized CHY-type Zn-finger protein